MLLLGKGHIYFLFKEMKEDFKKSRILNEGGREKKLNRKGMQDVDLRYEEANFDYRTLFVEGEILVIYES